MNLKELFFGKPNAGEKKQLSLEQAKELLKRKKAEEEKELEKKAGKKFSEINALIKDGMESLRGIGEMDFEAEGENKFLRKIVQSSKEEFVQKMQNLLEKTRPPEGREFRARFDYCRNALREYQQEITGFRKNIAYTGILVKKEMQNFAKGIESMEKELAFIAEIAQESKWQKAAMLAEKAEGIEALKKQALEAQAKAGEIEKETARLEEQKKEAEEKRKVLQEGERFKELEKNSSEKERLEQEKSMVKEKALNILAPLEKQLRKMQTLGASGEWLLEKEQERMLNAYLQDCFTALKQDPKGEVLKQVLQEMRKAIKDGKIAFKEEKERAKKEAAIGELENYDFFNNFFWKLNEIEKRLPGIYAEMQNSTLFREISAANSEIQAFEREKAQKNREEIAVKEKKDRIMAEIALEAGKLSEIARQELGEDFEITSSTA